MTSKCVSRHSPVHFFENCQRCSRADVSNMLAWKHSCAACNFWFLIPPDSSTPAALASLPFDPPAPDWEKHSASHLFYPFARVDLLCTCFSLTLATLFFKATYAMFVLIDWTWLNDVCLQVILKPYARHPQGLRFSSGRFRAKKAFQLLADAEWSLIGTSCQWQIISRLLTFYIFLCSYLPQVSNLNCSSSSSHLFRFHGYGEASYRRWANQKKETKMRHEKSLHHA